jgi:hypothetical protein
MEDCVTLQILNLLSILRNQVFGSWDPECHVGHVLVSVFFFCRQEVDFNRVQERACAKAGSTLCRSRCFVLYSKTCTWVLECVVRRGRV